MGLLINIYTVVLFVAATFVEYWSHIFCGFLTMFGADKLGYLFDFIKVKTNRPKFVAFDKFSF